MTSVGGPPVGPGAEVGVREVSAPYEPEFEFDGEDTRPGETPRQRVWRRFRSNRIALCALVYLVLLAIAVIFAPWIAPRNPNATTGPIFAGPGSSPYWLGTDSTGRDILSRLIWGGRSSLEVASLVVVFSLLVALPLGLIAGYFRGGVDAVIMRIMDGLFAFPALTLALAVSAILGPNLVNASIAIAVPFIPGMVRLIRAQVLSVREETFVEASHSVGVTSRRMMTHHLFPNVASPMIVQLALSFGFALLAEAGLSFLSLGVQPPNSSWGTMLEEAYNGMLSHPWPLYPPGIAIAATVLAFNLIADGFRDALGRETFRADKLV